MNLTIESRGADFIEVTPGSTPTPDSILNNALRDAGIVASNDSNDFDVPAGDAAQPTSEPAPLNSPTQADPAAIPSSSSQPAATGTEAAPASLRSVDDKIAAFDRATGWKPEPVIETPDPNKSVWEIAGNDVRDEARALKAAQSGFKAYRDDLWNRGMLPSAAGTRLVELRRQIQRQTNPDEIEKLVPVIRQMASLAKMPDVIGRTGLRMLNQRFEETVVPAFNAFVYAVQANLQDRYEAAIGIEAKFFAKQGLPHEPTALSRQFKNALTAIQDKAQTMERLRAQAGSGRFQNEPIFDLNTLPSALFVE